MVYVTNEPPMPIEEAKAALRGLATHLREYGRSKPTITESSDLARAVDAVLVAYEREVVRNVREEANTHASQHAQMLRVLGKDLGFDTSVYPTKELPQLWTKVITKVNRIIKEADAHRILSDLLACVDLRAVSPPHLMNELHVHFGKNPGPKR